MKPIEKSERYTLSQLVVQNIKQLILERNLSPGDKLPAERELAQVVGVSRAILREALRALESFGIVEIKHGEGTYVSAHFLHPLVEQLSFVMQMNNPQATADIRDIRYWLEAAALNALPGAEASGWEALAQAAERYADPALAADERAEADAQLHLSLIALTGNRTLLQLAEPFVRQTLPRADDEALPARAEEHARYIAAARDGDTLLARELLHAHLATSSSSPRP